MRRTLMAAFVSAALLAPATAAQAAGPGSLDPSFAGGQGVETLTPGALQTANSVAVAPDGSIYVGGALKKKPFNGITFAVFKYHPDGSPDTSFGKGGVARNARSNGASKLVLQPDGKLLAVGGKVLVRYLPDGTRDPSFGNRGVVLAPGPATGSGAFADAGVDARGRIVVLSGTQLTLLRPDGSLFRRVKLPDDLELGRVVVKPGGRFVVLAGRSYGERAVALGYRRNGDPDPSFGTNGVAEWGSAYESPERAALQPDGSVVFVVTTLNSNVDTVVRICDDGSLDPSFGHDGRIHDFFGGVLEAVALQPDGRIVVFGNGGTADGKWAFRAMRLLANGAIDTSFGSGGAVVTPIPYQGGYLSELYARDVAVTPAGKILALGWGFSGTRTRSHIILAQYLAS